MDGWGRDKLRYTIIIINENNNETWTQDSDIRVPSKIQKTDQDYALTWRRGSRPGESRIAICRCAQLSVNGWIRG